MSERASIALGVGRYSLSRQLAARHLGLRALANSRAAWRPRTLVPPAGYRPLPRAAVTLRWRQAQAGYASAGEPGVWNIALRPVGPGAWPFMGGGTTRWAGGPALEPGAGPRAFDFPGPGAWEAQPATRPRVVASAPEEPERMPPRQARPAPRGVLSETTPGQAAPSSALSREPATESSPPGASAHPEPPVRRPQAPASPGESPVGSEAPVQRQAATGSDEPRAAEPSTSVRARPSPAPEPAAAPPLPAPGRAVERLEAAGRGAPAPRPAAVQRQPWSGHPTPPAQHRAEAKAPVALSVPGLASRLAARSSPASQGSGLPLSRRRSPAEAVRGAAKAQRLLEPWPGRREVDAVPRPPRPAAPGPAEARSPERGDLIAGRRIGSTEALARTTAPLGAGLAAGPPRQASPRSGPARAGGGASMQLAALRPPRAATAWGGRPLQRAPEELPLPAPRARQEPPPASRPPVEGGTVPGGVGTERGASRLDEEERPTAGTQSPAAVPSSGTQSQAAASVTATQSPSAEAATATQSPSAAATASEGPAAATGTQSPDTAATGGTSLGDEAAAAPDIDQLARDVYEIIRRRLRVEAERARGGVL